MVKDKKVVKKSAKATDNKVEAAHNKKINDLVAGGMDQEDAIKQVQKG